MDGEVFQIKDIPFETFHHFNDGNGRTGRILITMFLWYKKLLEMPILYLSSYFKQHRSIYYQKLNDYHNGDIIGWLDFFLDGIIDTANSAIKTCGMITKIRERDTDKIKVLGKAVSQSTMTVLENLYKMPIVGISDIMKWTETSKPSGYKMIERLVNMGILVKLGDSAYAQKWYYKDYINLFYNE